MIQMNLNNSFVKTNLITLNREKPKIFYTLTFRRALVLKLTH